MTEFKIGDRVYRTDRYFPDAPVVGDRVRVVHEGVVTISTPPGLGSGLTIKAEDGSYVYVGRSAKSVEILEPRPFPNGTIARNVTPAALPLIRGEGGWRLHSGELAEWVTDERVRGNKFEVIYEPPTT